jgi:hypothetical protein
MFERARDYSDAALSAIGLQPRRTATDYLLPVVGIFGVGLLVGAGLGLMLAPKRGSELRGDIGRRVRSVGTRLRRRGRDELDASGIEGSDDGSDGEVLSAVHGR